MDFNIFSVVLGGTGKGGSQEPLMPFAFKHNVNIRKVINAAQEMISAFIYSQKIIIITVPCTHTYIPLKGSVHILQTYPEKRENQKSNSILQ